ncbi:pyridoxine 5'-phosphate synthase [Candidatus Marinamargulisbacteria bacterium SCGC AG-439-L15]|nr:pyridoxine 5'-phosphate synthase [Candidatus Marinamargulisbacteria bacterium SCGC AG-439-L15]
MIKPKLSVNINKIALLRNSRETTIPSVLGFAKKALSLGACGITVHPRPDQRHITTQDVRDLSTLLKTYPDKEFNVEGNPFEGELGSYPGFMTLVSETRPDQCTLVPDAPNQKTSDHGWDFQKDGQRVLPLIQDLQKKGCRVSVFVDPIEQVIRDAAALKVDRIELYTESYARAFEKGEGDTSFKTYTQMAELATALGLGVNAGHDLNLENLPRFATLPGLLEVSIGHALVADSLDYGFSETVSKYLSKLG